MKEGREERTKGGREEKERRKERRKEEGRREGGREEKIGKNILDDLEDLGLGAAFR